MYSLTEDEVVVKKANPAYSLNIEDAALKLTGIIKRTPLIFNQNLSRKYKCNVYLKREDLQNVRSYKIRGAFNMISSLSPEQVKKGVVCASAGNHAQGFSYSCNKLGLKGTVFMPSITPKQKIRQVQLFGEDNVDLVLVGDTFDDCQKEALKFAKDNEMTFIPPFDHLKIIEGQGTVGLEILEDLPEIDYLFVPVGGGGLTAGIGSYFQSKSPQTKIIGAEPLGAPSMFKALEAGKPVLLQAIDRFVDGAAVKQVGNLTFEICKNVLNDMLLVPEGLICSTILKLYNEDAIVAEPAGALSVAALELYKKQITGKNVVCIISGSNNDIDRLQEIKERSLLYEGLKHYFIVQFPQRAGALKEFVNNVLGQGDDITRFEFIKKNDKETGPALIGIELRSINDYNTLISNMKEKKIHYKEINSDRNLFEYLI